MAMPKKVRCKKCNGHVGDVGPLSARKLCADCGIGAVWRSAYALRLREGPEFEHWRRATILALLNLDTSPGTSLDVISDVDLARLLSGAAELVLPSH